MIQPVRIVAVIDACVFYPAPVRDLLLNLGDVKLFQPKWTNAIHDEWINNLLKNRGDLLDENLRKTVAAMNNAFPDANVEDFEKLITALNLPDQNDCHVLAAAIKSKAKYIVTYNLKDFQANYLKHFKISAIHPDIFISELMITNERKVIDAFKQQVHSLKNPPLSQEAVLNHLEKCSLNKTVNLLKKILINA